MKVTTLLATNFSSLFLYKLSWATFLFHFDWKKGLVLAHCGSWFTVKKIVLLRFSTSYESEKQPICKMLLNHDECRVFQIHRYCFYHMWNLPVFWDSPNYTKLLLTNSRRSKLLYSLATVVMIWFGILNFLCIFYHGVIFPRPHYKRANTFSMLCFGSLLLMIVSISLVALNGNFVKFLNDLLKLSRDISRGNDTFHN